MIKQIKWVQIIIALIIGFFIGLPINSQDIIDKLFGNSTAKSFREGQKGLINPLLGFEISTDKADFKEYQPLENKLIEIVNQKINDYHLTKISIYFRDINNGHWTGVNENDVYNPASLLKVPLMIAYYRVAEDNPATLYEKIQYNNKDSQNDTQTFKPAKNLIQGNWYTVEDLIARMIMYSDNNAYFILLNHIKLDYLKEVFSDLNVNLPSFSQVPSLDYMSAKKYSYFFRVLYSSTYLTQEYSQKALELLTKSDFNVGIVAGLPSNITVAHKFGEKTIVDKKGNFISKELHDCGIIYPSGNPYLLCIMSIGNNFDVLKNTIKDISALVYSDSQNK